MLTAVIQATDTELLDLLTLDNRDAFNTLYDRYWELLYNAAYKRLKDKEQCKDIIQDVFIDLWCRRGQVTISNIKAYLLTAVRFQIYKLVAKEKAGPAFFELYETIASSTSGAEGTLIEKEFLDHVKAWIDELPEKKRTMFLLHTQYDKSTKEIANELSLSQKTVQNQLGSIIYRLRLHIAHFFMML
ncbi:MULTISPECIES: RNA polymerase sigma factor [Niastella]|uniref:Sigma-70 family RNA polymerase sigma factor n=1 Tax=Niastella soli TaxID=2821487 RepID=A0ABS3Z1R7_9BACT|nr:sigma-70 family RNA polymerase sigma factor [Niastella soli]MBO9204111.1 sigma-70 family RNA polymerase sigma factor [Niastella soli]